MMRNLFFLLATISVLASCNNEDNEFKSTATQNDNINNNIATTSTEQATDSISQYAYIKSVIKKADSVFITTDFIQYLTGDEAVAAAKKNGDADTAYDEKDKIISVYVANDYYILNNSKKLRQLPVARNCIIETQASTVLAKITIENFIKRCSYHNFPFILQLKNNRVVKMTELYLP